MNLYGAFKCALQLNGDVKTSIVAIFSPLTISPHPPHPWMNVNRPDHSTRGLSITISSFMISPHPWMNVNRPDHNTRDYQSLSVHSWSHLTHPTHEWMWIGQTTIPGTILHYQSIDDLTPPTPPMNECKQARSQYRGPSITISPRMTSPQPPHPWMKVNGADQNTGVYAVSLFEQWRGFINILTNLVWRGVGDIPCEQSSLRPPGNLAHFSRKIEGSSARRV